MSPSARRDSREKGRRLRLAAGISLLVFQIAAIGYARFVETRYFCWAPFDRISVYEIAVTLGDRELDGIEIARRYGIPAHGSNQRSIHHVFALIRQREAMLAAAERALVEIRYRVNGHHERTWQHR